MTHLTDQQIVSRKHSWQVFNSKMKKPPSIILLCKSATRDKRLLWNFYCVINRVLTLMCSGEGWSQLDPVVASELLSQIQEGEFWVDEEEFFREFDEITVGFPVNEEGQLQSLYTGVV